MLQIVHDFQTFRFGADCPGASLSPTALSWLRANGRSEEDLEEKWDGRQRNVGDSSIGASPL
jgi:hypothetical protein